MAITGNAPTTTGIRLSDGRGLDGEDIGSGVSRFSTKRESRRYWKQCHDWNLSNFRAPLSRGFSFARNLGAPAASPRGSHRHAEASAACIRAGRIEEGLMRWHTGRLWRRATKAYARCSEAGGRSCRRNTRACGLNALCAAGVNLDLFQPNKTGVSDLATRRPDLAAQWHPIKNGELTPEGVTVGSNRKVWWRYWSNDSQSWHGCRLRCSDARRASDAPFAIGAGAGA